MSSTKIVKWLAGIVVLQGIVLFGVVLFLVNSQTQISSKAIHADRITTSRILLCRGDGVEVGRLSIGCAGPYLHLHSGTAGTNDVRIGLSELGTGITIHDDGSQVRLGGFSNGAQLEIEDVSVYYQRLLLGTGRRTLAENVHTNCWVYHIPGLASGSYPENEKVLREQLAALTPEMSRRDQREVLTQLKIIGLFEKELPTIFALCERFPEEKEFPHPFVSMFEGLEGERHYSELFASLKRQPSRISILLLKRIINGERYEINGIDLRALLGEIAGCEDLPPKVREDAERMHQHTLRHYPRNGAL